LNEQGVRFQRIISTIVSKQNYKSRYAVVQYLHKDSSEDDIIVKPHGNTKDPESHPFFKTDPAVIEKIKKETEDSKPRSLFKKLVDDAGGPLYCKSASSEPRNLQQIYNVRKSTKASSKMDQLAHLMIQIQK
jgi:hypothetical protein